MRLAQVLATCSTTPPSTPPDGRPNLADGRAAGRTRPWSGSGTRAWASPPEMLPSMFDLFTQVDRTLDRAEGGLGIGLTLVRRLTEMHGGTVAATSAGRARAASSSCACRCCRTTAPAAGGRADGGAPAAGGLAAASWWWTTTADAAESLALLLRLFGNEVRTAHDGRLALEVAAAYRPDVVLLDIGLPGLDGLEVCRHLRAAGRGIQPLILAMTGYGQEEDRRGSRGSRLRRPPGQAGGLGNPARAVIPAGASKRHGPGREGRGQLRDAAPPWGGCSGGRGSRSRVGD